ncbi:MAG: glycosyltransferase, partial [Synechococcaceae cyanobacterium]|nr:glycosyltransferase [Synechococcaceae cyanobacterium]
MRIGLYASIVASDKGHERNVSAHVQVPVHTLRVLREAGHEAHLITNEYGADKTMPACMPEGAPVHLVPDGRKRPKNLRGGKGTRGVSVLRLLQQLRAIVRVARAERLEVLHVFGYLRSGCLAGLLRLLGLPCPVVFTFVGATMPARLGGMSRFLLRRVDRLVASTEYTARVLEQHGFEATVCRHGIVRDIVAE